MLQRIDFDSWEQFKSQTSDILTSGDCSIGDFVFRGMSDSQWSLRTSLQRHFGKTAEPINEIMIELLQEFRHQLRLAGLGSKLENREESDIWALAQHFSLPTPLLDWSRSPYVAAYFAMQEALLALSSRHTDEARVARSRAAIWAARRHGSDDDWATIGVEFFDRIDSDNDRLRAQLGLFSKVSSTSSLDELVAKYARETRSKKTLLFQFTIPHASSLTALQDLNLMNINSRTLFSDMDGVCRSALINFQIRRLARGFR